LIFVFFANHEIKGVVRHPKVPHLGLPNTLRLIRAVPLEATLSGVWRVSDVKGNVLQMRDPRPHWRFFARS
jgi:hypothetical protein